MEAAKKPIDEIVSFFTGNPFSTPVGHKIEEATDPNLPSENWALNLEICDLINNCGSDEVAKEAVRAIRKRLQQFTGKNYTVVMYTLTVLETCVKNCSTRFHVLVTSKDFISELVKLIGPKNDPPVVVQEKILGLIQSWATAFENGGPEVSGVVGIYQDLRSKGIEFPPTDLDSLAPIFTPKRSVAERVDSTSTGTAPLASSEAPILHQVDLGERQIKPSSDQISKIRRDLDLVQGNMGVFAELLNELKPGDEGPGDLELIQELYTSCKEMQRRIGELLCSICSDELTAELLHVNDELNNLFLRYGRYRKNVEKTGTANALNASASSVQSPGSGPGAGADEPSLIDFGSPSPSDQQSKTTTQQQPPDLVGAATSKMSGLGLGGGSSAINSNRKSAGDSDFDMFAQSRNATYEKSKTSGSSYADNQDAGNLRSSSLAAAAAAGAGGITEEEIIKTHRQSDFDEMEAWLEANPKPSTGSGAAGAPASTASSEKSLTSSEFDRFLQERAAANPTNAAKDKEKTESKMFGL